MSTSAMRKRIQTKVKSKNDRAVDADPVSEPEPVKEPGDCKTPGCLRKGAARGICECCYTTALRYVRKKRITWRRLEELGFVNAPRASRPIMGPMSLQIEAALGSLPK